MDKVLLSSNPYKDTGLKNALSAYELLKGIGIEAKVCLPFEAKVKCEDVKLHALEDELKDSDLLVCFGGDGTILHSAKLAAYNNVPILGVNVGTMGFMAEIESNELDLILKVIAGDYRLENRMMLDISVFRGEKLIYSDIALNDAVITKGAIARIIDLSVLCDGEEITKFSGDGVIISTPTGSTAYSMSAGGPIVEPTAETILMTPICAHALYAKSFVLSGDREVNVKIGSLSRKTAYLSSDGGRAVNLIGGDRVVVKRSDYYTSLVRVKNISYFRIIYNKFK